MHVCYNVKRVTRKILNAETTKILKNYIDKIVNKNKLNLSDSKLE